MKSVHFRHHACRQHSTLYAQCCCCRFPFPRKKKKKKKGRRTHVCFPRLSEAPTIERAEKIGIFFELLRRNRRQGLRTATSAKLLRIARTCGWEGAEPMRSRLLTAVAATVATTGAKGPRVSFRQRRGPGSRSRISDSESRFTGICETRNKKRERIRKRFERGQYRRAGGRAGGWYEIEAWSGVRNVRTKRVCTCFARDNAVRSAMSRGARRPQTAASAKYI